MTPSGPHSTCDVLYLSPHLDDVVFSCAGRLLADREARRRAVIVTAFDLGDHHRIRRLREDSAAAVKVGAEARCLGLVDAPWRSGRYRTFEGIVFDRDPGDEQTLRELRRRIDSLVSELQPSEIVAPLGIGGHIDHRLLFEAAWGRPSVSFYEDRPYALVPIESALRLHAVGGIALDEGRLDEWEAAFVEAPYVTAWLPKARVAGVVNRKRQRTVELHVAIHALQAASIDWEWGPEIATGALAAVACYRSQLADTFGGEGALARLLSPDGRWRERQWRLHAAQPAVEATSAEEAAGAPAASSGGRVFHR